jgi:hypothetical protein
MGSPARRQDVRIGRSWRRERGRGAGAKSTAQVQELARLRRAVAAAIVVAGAVANGRGVDDPEFRERTDLRERDAGQEGLEHEEDDGQQRDWSSKWRHGE